MIANPFSKHFSNNESSAVNAESENDKQTALLMYRLINRFDRNTPAIEQLCPAITRSFNVSSVFLSLYDGNTLKLSQVWQNQTSFKQTLSGEPASEACHYILTHKQHHQFKEVDTTFPDDSLLSKFGAISYLGFPIFGNDYQLLGVIGIIDTKSRDFSEFCKVLMTITAERIALEIQTPPIQTQSNPDNDDLQTNQISHLKTEISDVNQSLESLSHAVSHDLRAPLRTIDSFSQLINDEYSSHLPEEAINYLTRVRRASKRMRQMIDDLLWLSKVTRSKLEKQEINLGKLATKIFTDIKETHPDYDCTLKTENNMIIYADKHLISIAINNLLDNACKFSDPNKITEINISREIIEHESIYHIKDNGCGFDMSFYQQLFEPFKKLHISEKYPGTGIGLATVQRIFKRHAGKIWAESEPGEGTSFFFTLPEAY